MIAALIATDGADRHHRPIRRHLNASAVDLRDSFSAFEDCSLDEPESLACYLTIMALDTAAQTLVVKLEGVAKRGLPAFIGAAPDEIEDISR